MSLRRPHYLPGNKSSETIQHAVWVDTETVGHAGADGAEHHTLEYGFACYRRRRNNGHWCAPEWLRFTRIEQFWEWMIARTRPRTRLYVFAHNGGFDLPVLHAFTELPARGFTIKSVICDAPPIDITWQGDRTSIRFIDTLNIWRQPLAMIGDMVRLPKLKMPAPTASRARRDAYCRRDVKVIMRACLMWFDFLATHDLGGFKPTLASQAFAAYRHRFMPYQIAIHSNERALALERAAFVGGRTECFYLGEYHGEFTYIDVNSMYPSVMRGNRYPVQLRGVYNRPTRNELLRWRQRDAVIVDCTIKTDVPAYPLLQDDTLIFPVGRFRVTLAGPEFWHAFDAGRVSRIHAVSVYEAADIFTRFVDELYRLRQDAKARGDETTAWQLKILMNSLYGKFGQRGRHYETVDECEPNRVEVWDELDADTGEHARYRAFGGVIQRWTDEGEAYHSMPAINAYVTSYARMVLWQAIELAGLDHVYYCDTDSLVLDQAGFDRISHLLDADRLGAWSIDRRIARLQLRGPKDYAFDDLTRTKGVRSSAIWLSDSLAAQEKFVGFRGLLRRGSLDAPIIEGQFKNQRREYRKGIPAPNGRVLPFRLGPHALHQ